jgi:hypothetical protein
LLLLGKIISFYRRWKCEWGDVNSDFFTCDTIDSSRNGGCNAASGRGIDITEEIDGLTRSGRDSSQTGSLRFYWRLCRSERREIVWKIAVRGIQKNYGSSIRSRITSNCELQTLYIRSRLYGLLVDTLVGAGESGKSTIGMRSFYSNF